MFSSKVTRLEASLTRSKRNKKIVFCSSKPLLKTFFRQALHNFPHRILAQWYKKNKRPLPWRDHPTPYHVWISEMMLQQTQVRSALPYYLRFLRRFPRMSSLAQASESEVLRRWSGLGYYSRARNMLKTARIVFKNFRGHLPMKFEELIQLPGIGPYTAGAILSIAYNLPIPILDGNVRRVLSRVFLTHSQKKIHAIAAEIVSKADQEQIRPSDFNQSLMELGALVCLPQNPLCGSCPTSHFCQAKKRNLQSCYPQPRPRAKTRFQWLASGILRKRNASGGKEEPFLIQRRSEQERWLKNLWELPMVRLLGKNGIENRSCSFADLSKKFSKKLKAEVQIEKCVGSFTHTITYHRLNVLLFEGRFKNSKAFDRAPCQWIRAAQIDKIPASSMLRKAIAFVN